jgi:hypothetical protein
MKNTIRPFALGSNVMIEIVNGTIRQLKSDTLELIKEISCELLNDQQVAAIEKARNTCTAAMIAQGFLPVGSTNEK